MTDLNFDETSSKSLWSTVISVALLILAIKFPPLFILNGIIGLGFGTYFLIISYTNLAKENLNHDKIVLYNYVNFMGWTTTILGAASFIIYFILKNSYNK
jgi:hypothetical protein